MYHTALCFKHSKLLQFVKEIVTKNSKIGDQVRSVHAEKFTWATAISHKLSWLSPSWFACENTHTCAVVVPDDNTKKRHLYFDLFLHTTRQFVFFEFQRHMSLRSE